MMRPQMIMGVCASRHLKINCSLQEQYTILEFYEERDMKRYDLNLGVCASRHLKINCSLQEQYTILEFYEERDMKRYDLNLLNLCCDSFTE